MHFGDYIYIILVLDFLSKSKVLSCSLVGFSGSRKGSEVRDATYMWFDPRGISWEGRP